MTAGENKGDTMTSEEIQAENARLERELHAALESNDRLQTQVAAANERYERAHENWRNELAKIKAGGDAPLSPESTEAPCIELEVPGVISIRLTGDDALRAFGYNKDARS